MKKDYSKELLQFISSHPSVFHVIEGQKSLLMASGYKQLLESEKWKLQKGGKYFVIRNGSAILAFRVPTAEFSGFMVMASHSDSPVLKVKENPDITVKGLYKKLNVELYGGALLAQWFDRPLSAAGRVFLRTASGVGSRLVNINRDLLLIPSLAIHMNRTVNSGYEYKVQRDLLPLYGTEDADDFLTEIAKEADVAPNMIIGHDLYLYNRQAPSIWGAHREFMSSPKLDDLQCSWSSLMGFLESEEADCIPVHVVFDNEEVGSVTKQGAASGFLKDTLKRITECLGLSESEYLAMLPQSFMLSGDNAHAAHPNYMSMCDPVNRPKMGGGVVLKYSGNQKYATDAASAAIVNVLAERAGVKLQVFTNHSDIPGGATLGNISAQQVSIKTADIGIAQLAMHSPYETCGTRDTEELVSLARQLFSSALTETADGYYSIIGRS